MATSYDWQCDHCGFQNSPNANRRGPEAQKTCEQCGAAAPAATLALIKKAAHA